MYIATATTVSFTPGDEEFPVRVDVVIDRTPLQEPFLLIEECRCYVLVGLMGE